MHREGLVVATSGNSSVRDGELVLVSPTALPYEEMTEADVVALDLDGRVVAGEREPSSEHRLHLRVYREREDAGAIVHSHSPYATAWSFLGEELDLATEDLGYYAGGAVRTAAFAPTGSDEIGEAAVEALAGRRAALLARHGVVALGGTVWQALDVCRVVERQAQIGWLLRRG